MKRLYVLKVGTTFPATAERFGDFDHWTLNALGHTRLEARVVDVERGAQPPAARECAGVVITGSHAMVTDELPWSVATEAWIPSLLDSGVPIFGVCYGHQLLARAAGGEVGYHPRGQEIGTVEVKLLPDCENDPIFRGLPESFLVHASHSQTVLRLPPGAVHLAANEFEPNHAYRIGENAWGVQFHPEYNEAIMRSCIDEQAERLELRGRDVASIRNSVSGTPSALRAIRNFTRYAEERA